MRLSPSVFSILLLYFFLTACGPLETENYTDRIDPLLAFGDREADPSVSVPFGMIQLTPITELHPSEMAYPGSFQLESGQFIGFEHFNRLRKNNPKHPDLRISIKPNGAKDYAERSIEKELAATGRYAVLQQYPNFQDIRVEGSTGDYSSLIEYQLQSGQAHELFIESLFMSDSGRIRIERPDSAFLQLSIQFTDSTALYALIRLSKLPQKVQWVSAEMNQELQIGQNFSTDNRGKLRLHYDTFSNNQNLYINTAFSRISTARVQRNLELDSKGWWLEGLIDANKQLWRTHLSKMTIQGGALDDQILYFSSHYRLIRNITKITESAGFFPKANTFGQDLSTDRYVWIGTQPSEASALWLRLTEAATLQQMYPLTWGELYFDLPDSMRRVLLAAGDNHILDYEITLEIQNSAIRTLSADLDPSACPPMQLCGLTMPGGGLGVRIYKPAFDYYKLHIGGTAYLEYDNKTIAPDTPFAELVTNGWKSPS